MSNRVLYFVCFTVLYLTKIHLKVENKHNDQKTVNFNKKSTSLYTKLLIIRLLTQ